MSNPQDNKIQLDSDKNATNKEEKEEPNSKMSFGNEISDYIHSETSSYNLQFYPGVERLEYDYVAERTSSYTTNVIESTAHVVKSSLGAGILGLHEAYMQGGLWTSLVTNMVIGFIITYNQLMLGMNAKKMYSRIRVPKLTYPDLVEVVFATGPIKRWRRHSKAFRYIIDACLFTQLSGTCCVYQIMIAKTLKQALEKVSTDIAKLSLHLRIYITIITLPLVLLGMIRNLKNLAPFSMIADIFIVLCVATTMYYSIDAAGDITERPAWKSIQGLFRCAGVCIYSMDGIGMALPIENNMRHPEYFPSVMKFGMSIVVIIAMAVGFFGYWGWGESCRTPITIHMPLELGPIIVQFTLCVMLTVTFTIHFWVPFRILWRYVGRHFFRRRLFWEIFFKLLHIVVLTLLSLCLPNLNMIMSFMGNIFLTVITFTTPCVIDCLINWHEHGRKFCWGMIRNVAIISIGFFFGIGGLCSYA